MHITDVGLLQCLSRLINCFVKGAVDSLTNVFVKGGAHLIRLFTQ